MTITFIDENGYEIDRADNIGTYNAFWTLFSNDAISDIKSFYILLIISFAKPEQETSEALSINLSKS